MHRSDHGPWKELDIDWNSWRVCVSFNDTATSAIVAQDYYDKATQDMRAISTSATYDIGLDNDFGSWTNQIYVELSSTEDLDDIEGS